MELRQWQIEIAEFAKAHGLETPAPYRLLDVVSEVGELAKEFLNQSAYGSQPFRPDDRWLDEFGDVLFAVICLANCTNVDLEERVQHALQKYRKRIARKGDAGSGGHASEDF